MNDPGRTATAILVLVAVATGTIFAQSEEALLREAEDALYPDSFYMRTRIETKQPNRRSTEMVFESLHKDGVGTLIEIQEPPRLRGIRFLIKDESLRLFNPRSNSRRAIRLSPRDSFQGSLFSNHDLGNPGYTDDYEASHLGEETIDHPELGRVETVILEATAGTDEAPYGRIRMWLRREDSVPVQMEYYARSGLLFKRLYLSDIRELAGRQRPAVMRMESLQLENAFSRVEILELEERTDLPDQHFTEDNLIR
ncbi:MAG: outer membrane lipoprotein-sorting protein [Spirochaetaceae bacterium]